MQNSSFFQEFPCRKLETALNTKINNCIVFLVKTKNQILIQDTCKPKKTKSE